MRRFLRRILTCRYPSFVSVGNDARCANDCTCSGRRVCRKANKCAFNCADTASIRQWTANGGRWNLIGSTQAYCQNDRHVLFICLPLPKTGSFRLSLFDYSLPAVDTYTSAAVSVTNTAQTDSLAHSREHRRHRRRRSVVLVSDCLEIFPRVRMSSEQGGNPLRKFKLVFLGEQSGRTRRASVLLLLHLTVDLRFSRQDFAHHSFHVRQLRQHIPSEHVDAPANEMNTNVL